MFGAVRNYFGGDKSFSQGGSVLMLIQIEDLHYPRESLVLPLFQFDKISLLFRQIHCSPTSRNCWSHEAGSTAKVCPENAAAIIACKILKGKF